MYLKKNNFIKMPKLKVPLRIIVTPSARHVSIQYWAVGQ